jgi:hypothetical protein
MNLAIIEVNQFATPRNVGQAVPRLNVDGQDEKPQR